MDIGFDTSRLLLWIVLLPLFGAIVNGLGGRYADRRLVTTIGVGSVGLAFVFAVACFLRLFLAREAGAEHVRLVYDVYQWFSISLGNTEVPIRVAFAMDALSGIMTLVVTGVGLLIHIYSAGYMHDDPGYPRFFAYLNLFTASMLILVLASSFPVLFVGWEGVGLCSYLLIGYWWTNTDYAKAGRKAFIVNRIGDFGVLIGMFILVSAVGSFEFDVINARAAGGLLRTFTFLDTDSIFPTTTIATAACLFLFLGCAGKSAQIPLYVWLPDAMAGPTPVSALIHAATMVTAGVYLCCRLSNVFVLSATALSVIAIIGLCTALLAATIALVQNDIKKILAYSTVSQLGFMFAAVGVGAFGAAFFHVFTHAFFKACLFLGAGSVMHAVGAHGDADIRRLGGLRKYMPTTHWTFLVSCLAIAGVPLFSGFFSKDEILLGAALARTNDFFPTWVPTVVFVGLVIAATMTAFYMFRLYFLTFAGTYRSAPEAAHAHAVVDAHDHAGGHDDAHHHAYGAPHESPPSMTIPLVVLGFFAIVAGYLGLPHALHMPNWWGDWFEGMFGAVPAAAAEGHEGGAHGGSEAWLAMGAGTAAMLVGIGLAYALVLQRGDAALHPRETSVRRFFFNKWYVDELYNALFVRSSQMFARFLAAVDAIFVDGLLSRVTSGLARLGGWAITRMQSGLVYAYGAVLVVGMAVLGWWFVLPHPELEGTVVTNEVTFEAARGLGYSYRWDLDDDGAYENDWDATRARVSQQYDASDYHGLALLLGGRSPSEEEVVKLGKEPVLIHQPMFARRYSAGAFDSSFPPSARVENGKVVLRPNGAVLIHEGRPTREEVRLEPGDTVMLGGMGVVVGGVVRGRVSVRNAFGNVATETAELVVKPSSGAGEEEAPRAALEVTP